jgi:hypothetical protein
VRRVWNIALLTGTAALLLFLLAYQLPDTHWGGALQDWGHVPLFGVISALLLGLLRTASASSAQPPGRPYLLAFAATVALGGLAELVQRYQPERTPSFADLARDVLGAGCVLAVAASLDPRLRGERWWRSPARLWAARGLALAALLAISAPLAQVSWDYAQRDRAFPQLLSFESGWEERFLTLQTAELVSVPPPPGQPRAPAGEWLGRLTLSPDAIHAADFTGYSGFFIDEPYPDWRGFDALCFRVFSESASPLALSLRVEDEAHQSDNSPEDRFNRDFVVNPGWNEIRIPLAEVEQAPRTRPMDMARIRIVHLFVYRPAASVRVLLDDWRLE